jgi:hypothetical protein
MEEPPLLIYIISIYCVESKFSAIQIRFCDGLPHFSQKKREMGHPDVRQPPMGGTLKITARSS